MTVRKKPISILIADDQRILLDGMVSLMREDFTEVVEITKAEAVFPTYKKLQPDVVICDIQFEAGEDSGIELLDKIIEYDQNANVIIFSTFDTTENLRNAYDHGAKSFLSKMVEYDELKEAIHLVSTGVHYFAPGKAEEYAIDSLSQSSAPQRPQDVLDEAQLSVFVKFAEGHTQQDIADQLGIGLRTVEKYIMQSRRSLGYKKQTQATFLAIKHHLISEDRIEELLSKT